MLRRTRLLTLTGTGGAGKTRLALELARDAQASFADGAALVELATLTDPRPSRTRSPRRSTFARCPDRSSSTRSAISSRRGRCCSCWTTASTCSARAPRSPTRSSARAPQLTIVATSREPLRVPGEVVFRVPSLDDPGSRAPLAPERARCATRRCRLFVDRAAAAAPGSRSTRRTPSDVARICFRLDGLPLALELAAGRLGASARRRSPSASTTASACCAAGSQRGTDAPADADGDAPVEPRPARAPTSALLFRRLAVFAGGFELEAVEEVVRRRRTGSPRSRMCSARLVEKSLVAVEERGAERRYRLLETVRLYAQERLVEAGEARSARRAACALGARAGRAGEADRPGSTARRANLRAALRPLLAGEPHEALRLCVALAVLAAPDRARRGAGGDSRSRSGGGAGANRAPRPGAARRGGDRLSQRAPRHAACALAEESRVRSPSEIGDDAAEWRAFQFLGELGVARRTPRRSRCRGSSGRSRSRARSGSRRPKRSASTRSVSRLDTRRLRRAPTTCWRESIERVSRARRTPRAISSPLNIARDPAEPARGSGRACASSSRTRCSRSSRSPAPRRRLRAGEPGQRSPRSAATSSRARGAARRECGAVSRPPGTTPASRACSSAAPTSSSPRGTSTRRGRCSRSALEMRAPLSDRRGRGLVLVGPRARRDDRGQLRRRRAPPRRGARLFRRAGDRWGLASTLWRTADLALARGELDEAEARSARGARGARRDEARALARAARWPASPRSPRCAATSGRRAGPARSEARAPLRGR